MDVRVMHLFFINEKKTSIDINISDHMIVEAGAYANAESSFVAEGNIPADDREFLGKFSAPSGRMYLSHPWRSYMSRVGQKFVGGVVEFRDKLKKYAVEAGFKFSYVKNDKERVTATCTKKLDGCPWRVHASVCRTNGYFYIRRLNNNHTCSGRIRERRSKMMNSSIVSSIVADQIRSNPLIKPTDIIKNFKQNYGLDISYYNAWYGRMKAKKLVHGAEAVSYQLLTWYVKSVKELNPGSHCILECEPNSHRFKRLFVSYYGCIEGFRFCRPLLFLDGTFVKNNYKGTLLAATGKNGNQGFFPLAFAMVDLENEENWTWFMEQLSYMLTPQERTITFVSDRNKGLLESVATVFPHSHHAFCLEHLKRNVFSKYPTSCGKIFRDHIVHLFCKCAYAPNTPEAFDMHLRVLKDEGGSVMRTFLDSLPKENWSDAFFEGARYGEMWFNVAESFNSRICEEQYLPIYQLVDGIRVKMMEMNSERSRAAHNWNTFLCPEMEERLNQVLEVGSHWEISRSSLSIFEVHNDISVMVHLQKRFCSCYQWQIKGFQCEHAVAAIIKDDGNPYDYVEDFFTTEYYKSLYKRQIIS
ncbi:uncharacterized protein LOC126591625 [Malus sylvestris]|uniref:uncharacterized protein LOC126591625 n=1 Tax=Malus sylvestris TaxID=3752 RepID=UPI0021AD328D|nr:uncharacterized protein LOC126591625 [Malus sylvestris]